MANCEWSGFEFYAAFKKNSVLSLRTVFSGGGNSGKSASPSWRCDAAKLASDESRLVTGEPRVIHCTTMWPKYK